MGSSENSNQGVYCLGFRDLELSTEKSLNWVFYSECIFPVIFALSTIGCNIFLENPHRINPLGRVCQSVKYVLLLVLAICAN